MDQLTFDSGLGDFENKIFEKTNIPQENFFQKNFVHKTTAEKIHTCPVSRKKHVVQRKRYRAYTFPGKKMSQDMKGVKKICAFTKSPTLPPPPTPP